jgi:hypothetical protein
MVYQFGKKTIERLWSDYMNESITIDWGSGRMYVYLGLFFPTTDKKIRALIKIIHLDWEHEEQLISNILEFLDEEIPRLEDLKKKNAEKFFNAHQEVYDCEQRVSTGKAPNGVRLTNSEWMYFRKKLAYWKGSVRQHERDFNRCEKRLKKIKKNIQLIKKLTGRSE